MADKPNKHIMNKEEMKKRVTETSNLKRSEQIELLSKEGFIFTEKGHDVEISKNGETLGVLARFRATGEKTGTASGRVAAPSLSEHIMKFFIGRECFGLEELPEVATIFDAAAGFDVWFTLRNEEAYKQTKAAKKEAKKREEAAKKREEAANNFKALDVDKKAAQLVAMGVFATLEAAKKHLKKQTA